MPAWSSMHCPFTQPESGTGHHAYGTRTADLCCAAMGARRDAARSRGRHGWGPRERLQRSSPSGALLHGGCVEPVGEGQAAVHGEELPCMRRPGAELGSRSFPCGPQQSPRAASCAPAAAPMRRTHKHIHPSRLITSSKVDTA